MVHLRLAQVDVAESNFQSQGVVKSSDKEGSERISAGTSTVMESRAAPASSATLNDNFLSSTVQNERTPSPLKSLRCRTSSSASAPDSMNRCRKRPRGRVVRLVSVVNEENYRSATTTTATSTTTTKRRLTGVALPPNHYECTLFRRAIRKLDLSVERTKQQHQQQQQDGANFEEYGDVSLGMKLTVIGGKVIVQKLNALQDGRASPAQLARLVQRGDVLLSINDFNLVNLPIDQLMRGLSPLSSPDANGVYPRELRLRFASGEGLAILNRTSPSLQQDARGGGGGGYATANDQDAATDMFNLFPMVDNLSGRPLFEKQDFSSQVPHPPPPPSGPTTSSSTAPTMATAPIVRKDNPSAAGVLSSSLSSSSSSRPTTKDALPPPELKQSLSLDEKISNDLARDRLRDRDRFVSEFFAWSEDASTSELLRGPFLLHNINNNSRNEEEEKEEQNLQHPGNHGGDQLQQELFSRTDSSLLSLDQFIERGRRAVIGARALSDKIESVDRGGKENRSLKSWKTTLSLYSHRVSNRGGAAPRLRSGGSRRGGRLAGSVAFSSSRPFDAASVPANFGRVEEEEEDGDDTSVESSSYSDGEEQLDGDARLVYLAANDEVWRTQVIEFLEKVTQDRENDGKLPHHVEESDLSTDHSSMDVALSNELGTFLFGESMSKILAQQKKPNALPPEEITAILYDLTTKLSATIPVEIAANGSQGTPLTSTLPPRFLDEIAPAGGNIRATMGGNIQLATHFLLKEALPEWLKSFRPLPWDQRRILWPLDKPAFGGSTTASSTLSDDSYTLESVSTNPTGIGSGKGSKRKNLRERIEDQELNAQTRAETCFLTTYYFTQKLLPRLLARRKEGDSANEDLDKELLEEALAFVRTFGAYLKLHTSLAHAAAVNAGEVIDVLLELARHDPRHKELMKHVIKASSLVFYEPTMLSSIFQRLKSLKSSFVPDQWLATIDLCAAAFPDVRPWQVRRECMLSSLHDEQRLSNGSLHSEARKNELEDLYYLYLTQLLHPMDGHDRARKDSTLVREWCELSVRTESHGTFKERAPDRRRNFYGVAERTSGDHVVYARDLALLLQLSREIDDSELELEIAGEIMEGSREAVKSGAPILALEHLRALSKKALESFEDRDSPSAHRLRRILHIYQAASSCQAFIDLPELSLQVPTELLQWISYTAVFAKGGRRRTLQLVRFLADEADPAHVLEATQKWTSSSAPYFEAELLPVLQTVLFRAANQPTSTELSGVLYKLRIARQRLKHGEMELKPEKTNHQHVERHIWSRMSTGMIPVRK